jgi:protein SCO1/2
MNGLRSFAGRARALLSVLALAIGLVSCAEARRPVGPRVGGVEEHLGAALPLDAEFQSTQGALERLGQVVGRGQPTLLVLAYSRCAMLCSLVLRGAADLVPDLGLTPGQDYRLLTISIDPRETPYEAGRMQQVTLERAGLADASAWPFFVGQEASIRRVADSLGFRYAWDAPSEQYVHPAVIFTLSPAGRVSGYFYDLRPDPGAVRAALLGEAAPSARSVGTAVLSCFRFDALGRKYGSTVQRLFQAGATAVALGLAVGIALLFRRERRARGAHS